MTKPAELLVGKVLNGVWEVVEKTKRKPNETGSCFSVGYVVKHLEDGKTAFLKAIDFSVPADETQPAEFMQKKTSAFLFERDVLLACKEAKLKRVVVAIDDGLIDVTPINGKVQFLIFELADGSLHHRNQFDTAFDCAWAFRTAHHVATGLWQIHQRDIVHQDLKPSNVLIFKEQGSKIADLGRASVKVGKPIAHDLYPVAGDPTYAPIELHYRYVSPEWYVRRVGCDMYLLGSLLLQMLADVSLTGQILSRLPPDHRPRAWPHGYPKLIPVIEDIFGQVLTEAIQKIPETFRDSVKTILGELCNPVPELRGRRGPGVSLGRQFSVESYVGLLNSIATKAELGLKGKLPR